MIGKGRGAVAGMATAGYWLEHLTERNVTNIEMSKDTVRFDFDGNVSDYDTRKITEHTGFATEARGWSLFVWRPGTPARE